MSKKFDIFLNLKVLDNTPSVLSLGKFFDENGFSYEWINGQKPHLIQEGIRIICNTENFVRLQKDWTSRFMVEKVMALISQLFSRIDRKSSLPQR